MSIWQQRLSGSANHRPKDHRDPYQRDKARILHSAAFRRLQSKTQVLGVGQHDFYRTRLTHSLEVAQVSTGLTAQLRQSQQVVDSDILQQLIPNDPLIEALCLAHDLGHPPFGREHQFCIY
jgi:dGTPase